MRSPTRRFSVSEVVNGFTKNSGSSKVTDHLIVSESTFWNRFEQLQFAAVFVTVVEPGSFIDTHCLYHQACLPPNDRLRSRTTRIILNILRMSATIRINKAVRALRFRKYRDNIGMLNNHVRMDEAADGSYRTKGKTSR